MWSLSLPGIREVSGIRENPCSKRGRKHPKVASSKIFTSGLALVRSGRSTSKPSVLSTVFGYLVICSLPALDSIIIKLYASGYILTHILVTVMLLLCTRVSRNQGEKADCVPPLLWPAVGCGQKLLSLGSSFLFSEAGVITAHLIHPFPVGIK